MRVHRDLWRDRRRARVCRRDSLLRVRPPSLSLALCLLFMWGADGRCVGVYEGAPDEAEAQPEACDDDWKVWKDCDTHLDLIPRHINACYGIHLLIHPSS